MGLDSAVNAVARIFTPILFGKLYYHNSGMVFVAGGCVVGPLYELNSADDPSLERPCLVSTLEHMK
jgi:hypothetical protein